MKVHISITFTTIEGGLEHLQLAGYPTGFNVAEWRTHIKALKGHEDVAWGWEDSWARDVLRAGTAAARCPTIDYVELRGVNYNAKLTFGEFQSPKFQSPEGES